MITANRPFPQEFSFCQKPELQLYEEITFFIEHLLPGSFP